MGSWRLHIYGPDSSVSSEWRTKDWGVGRHKDARAASLVRAWVKTFRDDTTRGTKPLSWPDLCGSSSPGGSPPGSSEFLPAQQFQRDIPGEPRAQDQVSSPEALRFLPETEKPLEPVLLHPGRSLLRSPGDEVEGRARTAPPNSLSPSELKWTMAPRPGSYAS